ncbi:hypothetical protein [Sutterella sp.]|uniref:hypothetical protein n=1 Tax=Sutterella sp. TaxID=1981025 RepID=UPI0026DEF1EE|nr:hypothetical protein [Sutterella sp.]MDO5530755.1 hypothetical protein [Sutterella sp.]
MPEEKKTAEAKTPVIRPIKCSRKRPNQRKHPGWGGARKGCGRKCEGDKPLDNIMAIRFIRPDRDIYHAAGGTAWLRRLLNAILARNPDAAELELLRDRPEEHPVVKAFIEEAAARINAPAAPKEKP